MKRTPASSFALWTLPSAFVAGILTSWVLLYIANANPAFLPLASALVGLIVAFSIPVWQNIYLNAPKLSIEISSIRRTISDAATISIKDDPELKVLNPPRSNPFFGTSFSFSSDDIELFTPSSRSRPLSGLEFLDSRLASAKQRLRDLPAQIGERKADLERAQSLNAANLNRHDVNLLNRPISPEVEYDPADHQGVIDALIKAYHDRLLDLEKDYSSLQANLPIAERRIEVSKQDLVANRSLFTVSVSLINSGRSNTAVKAPGLLRVHIGQGNYIDIKLSLKDFENKSEVSANGTRIAIFESLEISSLPEEDRTLINTYWGQSVKAWILVEDVQGNAIKSNYISFAEGLYQKIIYDRLARAANDLQVD